MYKSFFHNLAFTYIGGGITPVDKDSISDYRILPYWVVVAPGHGPVKVDIYGDGTESCRPGQAVIVKPNVRHRFSMLSQAGFISRWSHVSFSLPGNIDVSEFLDSPVVITGTAGRRIGTINEQLAGLPEDHNTLHIESRYLELGFALLQIICSVSKEKDCLRSFLDQSHGIWEMLEYIDRNLDSELTRDDLAEYCGLSPARFHVVFKQCTGMAPMSFIKQQRMKKAKLLLAKTDMPVSQIARAVGYDDQYTFSRAFRNTVGLSPSPYRLQAGSDILSG